MQHAVSVVLQKRISAEHQLDLSNAKKEKESESSRAAAAAEKLKNNPLLKFLREKSAKKLQEKKLSKDRSPPSAYSCRVIDELVSQLDPSPSP